MEEQEVEEELDDREFQEDSDAEAEYGSEEGEADMEEEAEKEYQDYMEQIENLEGRGDKSLGKRKKGVKLEFEHEFDEPAKKRHKNH